jgi:hypothetical protein
VQLARARGAIFFLIALSLFVFAVAADWRAFLEGGACLPNLDRSH